METHDAVKRRPIAHGLRLRTLILAVSVTVIPFPGLAQTRPTSDAAAGWQPPRTPDGHPDLQGNWTNSTLTSFERPDGVVVPVYSREEVARIEQPDGSCPPNPGTVECGRPLGTGSDESRLRGQEYPEVYWDRGSRVAIVDGEARTSLVTRPADGRIPPLTPAAERRIAEAAQLRSRFGAYDHPELRPLGERCFSPSSAGPPMAPNGAYNNNYTIVQTADHVAISTEMVHDARIVRLGEPRPLPADVRPWHGDSWGEWQGDTLVVTTTHLRRDQAVRGVPLSGSATVSERFTRIDEETILYRFMIEDPETYTGPWGGEIPFRRFDDLLYEYACHEGNYALAGVLSGARYEERQASGGGR